MYWTNLPEIEIIHIYIYLLVFICYFIFSLYNTLVAGIHTRVRIVIFVLLFAQIGPFSDRINLSILALIVLLLSVVVSMKSLKIPKG